jgi:hypothetical protein
METGRSPLDLLKECNKLFGGQLNLAEDGPDQRPSQVSPLVMRDGSRSSIGVSVEYVATALPLRNEAEPGQDALHSARVDNGKPTQRGTLA